MPQFERELPYNFDGKFFVFGKISLHGIYESCKKITLKHIFVSLGKTSTENEGFNSGIARKWGGGGGGGGFTLARIFWSFFSTK